MVNFKASSHVGAHKRAQAGGASEHVSKTDKLATPATHDSVASPDSAQAPIALHVEVVELRPPPAAEVRDLKSCLVCASTLARLAAAAGGGPTFLRRPGGDCVLTARASAEMAAPAETIWLTEAQARNLRVCGGERYTFVPWAPEPGSLPLGAVFAECWLLQPLRADEPQPTIDGGALNARVARALFSHVVSVNELLSIRAPTEGEGGTELDLVLRVTSVLPQSADGADGAAAADSESAVSPPHVWRGVVGASTEALVSPLVLVSDTALDGHRQPSTRFALSGADATLARMRALEHAPRRHVLSLVANDGEAFPVHAALLKPCIALSRGVREAVRQLDAAPGAGAQLAVDVDTLSLDKVLLYLESELRSTTFALDVATAEQLRPVAAKLGCRGLTERCDGVLGDFAARLRVYRWSEVVEHNARGGCWIVMDGMVCDVERWLPEHPGGETIIPQQARGVDSTVWFELYHASRESFVLLKEFYIGEIAAEDLALVPTSADANGLGQMAGRASDDFMQQLRNFCDSFRIDPTAHAQAAVEPAFKSF